MKKKIKIRGKPKSVEQISIDLHLRRVEEVERAWARKVELSEMVSQMADFKDNPFNMPDKLMAEIKPILHDWYRRLDAVLTALRWAKNEDLAEELTQEARFVWGQIDHYTTIEDAKDNTPVVPAQQQKRLILNLICRRQLILYDLAFLNNSNPDVLPDDTMRLRDKDHSMLHIYTNKLPSMFVEDFVYKKLDKWVNSNDRA